MFFVAIFTEPLFEAVGRDFFLGAQRWRSRRIQGVGVGPVVG